MNSLAIAIELEVAYDKWSYTFMGRMSKEAFAHEYVRLRGYRA